MLKLRRVRFDVRRLHVRVSAPWFGVSKTIHPAWLMALGSFLLVVISFTGNCLAQAPRASEDQVKAAYLYNFAKFVEWPSGSFPNAEDAIVICSIGDDRVGEALQQAVLGKHANQRRVEAKSIGLIRESRSCHILFIGFHDAGHIRTILRSLQDTSILTVCQTDDLVAAGGMINLVRNNGAMELEINPEVAQASSLKISSRLLVVSRIVSSHGRSQ